MEYDQVMVNTRIDVNSYKSVNSRSNIRRDSKSALGSAATGINLDQRPMYPKSFALLRKWMECLFVGCFPENAVLFLWDQLLIREGKKESFHDLLPRFCCSLLHLLRGALLTTSTGFSKALLVAGRKVTTKEVIRAIKSSLSASQTAEDYELFQRNKAAKNIQRIFRRKFKNFAARN